MIKDKIIFPKHYNVSSIRTVLDDFEFVFKLNGKQTPTFHFELLKVEKPSMFGVLLLYKMLEYTVINNCFAKASITYTHNIKFFEFIVKYGFHELLSAFIADKDKKIEKAFNNLKVYKGDKFIIAPKALLREDDASREEINRTYLPQIQSYYKANEKAASMIMVVFSEILLNFWEHAKLDTQSIIVANGNNENIEIACADTGEGIISTLGAKYKDKAKHPEYILKKSIEKGNTSKDKTNHMGYGLWVLDEITSRTNGRMHIYSQGAFYFNEGGKKKLGKCGYWQGTIIYLSLPLHHPKTWEDIVEQNNELKIQWG